MKIAVDSVLGELAHAGRVVDGVDAGVARPSRRAFARPRLVTRRSWKPTPQAYARRAADRDAVADVLEQTQPRPGAARLQQARGS